MSLSINPAAQRVQLSRTKLLRGISKEAVAVKLLMTCWRRLRRRLLLAVYRQIVRPYQLAVSMFKFPTKPFKDGNPPLRSWSPRRCILPQTPTVSRYCRTTQATPQISQPGPTAEYGVRTLCCSHPKCATQCQRYDR